MVDAGSLSLVRKARSTATRTATQVLLLAYGDRRNRRSHQPPRAPHQFRTRNDRAKMQRTRSNPNNGTARSTKLNHIPPLITVWLQVRVLPGPPAFARFASFGSASQRHTSKAKRVRLPRRSPKGEGGYLNPAGYAWRSRAENERRSVGSRRFAGSKAHESNERPVLVVTAAIDPPRVSDHTTRASLCSTSKGPPNVRQHSLEHGWIGRREKRR